MKGKELRVVKRINNNTVLAKDRNNGEVILMGKGLGFQKNPGSNINLEQIERVFVLKSDKKENDNTIQLIESLSEDVLLASKEVVDVIEEKFHYELNPLVIFNLADHLEFSLVRDQNGILLENPLKQEISLLYPEEFKMAKFAIEYLNKNYDYGITENEKSFIAMHFVNSGKHFSNEMSETVIITRLTAEIVELLEENLGKRLDYSSIDFIRLTTHLRFFIIRNLRETHSEIKHIEMNETISSKFPQEYVLANKIAHFLKEKEGWSITDNERVYLTIHLTRVTHGG